MDKVAVLVKDTVPDDEKEVEREPVLEVVEERLEVKLVVEEIETERETVRQLDGVELELTLKVAVGENVKVPEDECVVVKDVVIDEVTEVLGDLLVVGVPVRLIDVV